MKHSKLIIFFLLITFSLSGILAVDSSKQISDENNEWYPFALSEKMDPDSPANIGKLVLDSPAGKHGFVTVKDGHFYFEDGTRAKFWGTNLAFGANFPSKKEAEMIANRLAFFGFNAVRLHHMDFYFEPRGIFEDIAPAYKDPQLKETGHLSKKQLDRLDYLIYQLKKRGIYVDFNLLVSRHFTEADGAIEPSKLDMAGKPASMFDPQLILLQKNFAKDLLSHINPYTGLSYNNDPAVAFIEITNETSLFAWWYANKLNGNLGGLKADSIPDYYVQILDELWLKWLKNKYISEQELKKVWNSREQSRPLYKFLNTFSSRQKEDIIAFYIDTEKQYFKEMTTYLNNVCFVKVPITGIGGCFLNEDVAAQEFCHFIDTHDYWDHPYFPPGKGGYHNFSIKNTSLLQEDFLKIPQNILSDKGRNLNTDKSKPFTISEWNHCFPNKYAYETPSYLAAIALKNDWDGLFQFAFSHGWKLYPVLNKIESYFDIIANPQQLLLNSVSSYIFLKSENIEIAPQELSHSIKSSSSAGIYGFIKDQSIKTKHFNITSNQNGSILLIALDNRSLEQSQKILLVTLSEVKNTDSEWDESGKYQWGKSPTLLKKIPITIDTPHNSKLEIYPLDESGKIKKALIPQRVSNKLIFETLETESPWYQIIK